MAAWTTLTCKSSADRILVGGSGVGSTDPDVMESPVDPQRDAFPSIHPPVSTSPSLVTVHAAGCDSGASGS